MNAVDNPRVGICLDTCHAHAAGYNVATIAGLIERRSPGQEKSKRQITVASDLIYNVLRRYEPDHILLRATRRDAESNLIDHGRLRSLLVEFREHDDGERARELGVAAPFCTAEFDIRLAREG